MKTNLEKVLSDVRAGVPVVVVDDYDRENEGDIVIAAEVASIANLVFTMNHAKGLMCIPMLGEDLDRLKIPPMVQNNEDKNQTPFAVSVDAIEGVSTGMSAADRLLTLNVLTGNNSVPAQLSRPGHLFPLRAQPGLLQDRRGHTEGSLQLLKLAGMKQVAIICEIMNDDGTMTSGAQLPAYCEKHDLNIISIEELYDAAYN